jgi:hypothetical protein
MGHRFFDVLDLLDQLLGRVPTTALFRESVQPLLENVWAKRYFFAKIEDAAWLPVLLECGVFDAVPNQGLGVFPSSTLKNLAQTSADEVMRILLRLPDTGNPWMHHDFLGIALVAMDAAPREVVAWAKREAAWIGSQAALDALVVEPAAQLAVRLCELGCAAGWDMSEAILGIRQSDDKMTLPVRAMARTDEWHYQDALSRLRQPLVSACGEGALRYFMELLIKASGQADPRAADEVIHMWCPAVGDAGTSPRDSLVESLLATVRDSATDLARTQGASILDVLETDVHKTFDRVALHIRRVLPELDPVETAATATSAATLSEELVRRELLALLRERFAQFPKRYQQRYFAYVRGQTSDAERFGLLAPVLGSAPEDLRARYEALAKVVHPEATDFDMVVSGFVGLTSPLRADEMAAMAPSNVAEAVRIWKPEGGLGTASPEGLTRELETYVSENAVSVSAHARAFIGLDPTYVRGVARGFAKAVESQVEGLDWGGIMELLEEALASPWGVEPATGSFESYDGSWQAAHVDIARLLETGLKQGKAVIGPTHLPSAWRALECLLENPDPTEEEERARLESADPATIAINTVRGVAMQAVMYYAFRVRERAGARASSTPIGECAPYVLSQLERHLDPAVEKSLAVRSVYGKWLAQLHGLDRNWTTNALDRIFPGDDRRRWEAAWDAYVAFSRVYLDLLDVLRPFYSAAVRGLGGHSTDLKALADPDRKVGGHLLLYYRHGAMALDDPLLRGFFSKAAASLRRDVLAEAARGVESLKEDEQAAVVARLRSLWEWRRTETASSADKSTERSAFCWWFIEPEFEPIWALQTLAEALDQGGVLELEGFALDRLEALATEHPEDVLRCVGLIVRKSVEPRWGLYDEKMKAILRAVRASSPALTDEVTELVHVIGSQGFLSFRELLSS